MSELKVENFDPAFVASELKRVGAVAVSLVPEDLRLEALMAFQEIVLRPSKFDYINSGDVSIVERNGIFAMIGSELDELVETMKPHISSFDHTPFNRLDALDYLPGAYLEPHIDHGPLDIVTTSLLLEGKSNFCTYPNAFVGSDPIFPSFDHRKVSPKDRYEIKSKPGDTVFFRQRNFDGLARIPHEIFCVEERRKVVVYNSIQNLLQFN